MPSFTKKAIVESFLRLAGKKPLDKITVRDVVDDCGINRNTFYYYFQDIYAVLEELCGYLTARMPSDATLAAAMETFFDLLGDFSSKYPRATKGLVMSLGYDGLERYFTPALDRIIVACLLRETAQNPQPREYIQRLTTFVRHAVFGYCLDFLRAEKNEPFADVGADLSHILEGMIRPLRGADSDKK